MRTTTFMWQGATFQLQENTVSSNLDAVYIANNIASGVRNPREWRHDLDFGNFMATATLKAGDPGFTLPSLDAPIEDLQAFYEVYEGLPGSFFNAVNRAQQELDKPINKAELAPGIDPKELETPPTAESVSTHSAA